MKLGGQARRVLDNFLDKWDHPNADNLDYEDAFTCEANRDVWTAFYKRKATFDLRRIHVATGGKAPIKEEPLEDPVGQPAELELFLAFKQDTFLSVSCC